MSEPIVILGPSAGATERDVKALKAAGLLVLRVKDVNAVRVLSTESVCVGNHAFRALLDMMEKMPSGYSDNDDNRARFANALVGYLQAEVREQGAGPGEGRGDG